MIIGVIGSRDLMVDKLEKYIPVGCDKIVSGGAVGIDKCAADYARKQGIELLEILPDYKKYGKAAPILRNKTIVDESHLVIAFWNGSSKGTKMVIEYCRKTNKPCTVIKMADEIVTVNVDGITQEDLNTAEKRNTILNSLTKLYSQKDFNVISNAPNVLFSIQDKLKHFSDKKRGKMETEISIEDLSVTIKIILPILFFSKENLDLLNDIQDQISNLIVMSQHNNIEIIISFPYFVDKESPHIKAWNKLTELCEKYNIDISEEFENITIE